ncbi:hypothetical protein MTO96_001608 [Rhipicephalus appendiculatus]
MKTAVVFLATARGRQPDPNRTAVMRRFLFSDSPPSACLLCFHVQRRFKSRDSPRTRPFVIEAPRLEKELRELPVQGSRRKEGD